MEESSGGITAALDGTFCEVADTITFTDRLATAIIGPMPTSASHFSPPLMPLSSHHLAAVTSGSRDVCDDSHVCIPCTQTVTYTTIVTQMGPFFTQLPANGNSEHIHNVTAIQHLLEHNCLQKAQLHWSSMPTDRAYTQQSLSIISASFPLSHTHVPQLERYISVPQSLDRTCLPQPKRHISVPQSLDRTCLQQPNRHISVPQSLDHSCIPHPERHISVPQSLDRTCLPQPNRHISVPQSLDRTCLPQPNRHISVPQSLDRTCLPQPERHISVPQSLDRIFIPQPERYVYVPQSLDRTSIPQPQSDNSTPQPSGNSCTAHSANNFSTPPSQSHTYTEQMHDNCYLSQPEAHVSGKYMQCQIYSSQSQAYVNTSDVPRYICNSDLQEPLHNKHSQQSLCSKPSQSAVFSKKVQHLSYNRQLPDPIYSKQLGGSVCVSCLHAPIFATRASHGPSQCQTLKRTLNEMPCSVSDARLAPSSGYLDESAVSISKTLHKITDLGQPQLFAAMPRHTCRSPVGTPDPRVLLTLAQDTIPRPISVTVANRLLLHPRILPTYTLSKRSGRRRPRLCSHQAHHLCHASGKNVRQREFTDDADSSARQVIFHTTSGCYHPGIEEVSGGNGLPLYPSSSHYDGHASFVTAHQHTFSHRQPYSAQQVVSLIAGNGSVLGCVSLPIDLPVTVTSPLVTSSTGQ